jgi:hypothetical protein
VEVEAADVEVVVLVVDVEVVVLVLTSGGSTLRFLPLLDAVSFWAFPVLLLTVEWWYYLLC